MPSEKLQFARLVLRSLSYNPKTPERSEPINELNYPASLAYPEVYMTR
ncbi:hypothetical protein KL86PLE_100005 [uncultured Pleomorphomonas sp.]|uniref:Uncharacterized protein n=1 Tax=uncultured Pleomorphomonas sp. TaxID=442121 RepID=A0A212L0M6_9HYPH|nr:hypothetical protein KL86PLE_100005 [uncultured Pleomorphomonas sp.]